MKTKTIVIRENEQIPMSFFFVEKETAEIIDEFSDKLKAVQCLQSCLYSSEYSKRNIQYLLEEVLNFVYLPYALPIEGIDQFDLDCSVVESLFVFRSGLQILIDTEDFAFPIYALDKESWCGVFIINQYTFTMGIFSEEEAQQEICRAYRSRLISKRHKRELQKQVKTLYASSGRYFESNEEENDSFTKNTEVVSRIVFKGPKETEEEGDMILN